MIVDELGLSAIGDGDMLDGEGLESLLPPKNALSPPLMLGEVETGEVLMDVELAVFVVGVLVTDK